MKSRLLIGALLFFGLTALADPPDIYIRRQPVSEDTLQDFIDFYTADFVRDLAEDPDADDDAVEATPDGWLMNRTLIVDFSSVPESLRAAIEDRLRRIYLAGESWEGRTYRLGEKGRVGLSLDWRRLAARLPAALADGSDAKVTELCDVWLTRLN